MGTTVRLSRRELAIGALLAGGIGAVSLGELPAVADSPTQTPAQILSGMVSLELLAVFAYQRVSTFPQLTPLVAHVVAKYLSHEQQHLQALTDELAKLGVVPPATPATTTAADALLSAHGGSASFSSLHTQDDCLKILQQVEAAVEGGYFMAVGNFEDPTILRTFAEIMAAEAQHATSLTGLRHPGAIDRAVPYAFVEGTH